MTLSDQMKNTPAIACFKGYHQSCLMSLFVKEKHFQSNNPALSIRCTSTLKPNSDFQFPGVFEDFIVCGLSMCIERVRGITRQKIRLAGLQIVCLFGTGKHPGDSLIQAVTIDPFLEQLVPFHISLSVANQK